MITITINEPIPAGEYQIDALHIHDSILVGIVSDNEEHLEFDSVDRTHRNIVITGIKV